MPSHRRLRSGAVTAGMTNPEWAPQLPSQQPAAGPVQSAQPPSQAAKLRSMQSGRDWRGIAQLAALTAASLAVCKAYAWAGWLLTSCLLWFFACIMAYLTLLYAIHTFFL